MCMTLDDVFELVVIGMKERGVYCLEITHAFWVLFLLCLCSIRLGIFLRRYPIARVFVIIYMVSKILAHFI